MKSIKTPGSRPDGPGIDSCLPKSQTGPSLPPYSPLTWSWMGAVFRGLRRGSPRLKLQEKVGWVVPPWAGITISSECSVKSPVSGCLLVSSFTSVPVVGMMRSNTQNGMEGYQEEGSWVQGTLAVTFAIGNQKFPI